MGDLVPFLTARFSDGPMTDVMVDIETTGLDPAHTAIMQIGAVKFNYHTEEVGDIFNRCLGIPQGRFWDADTQTWWSQQNRSVLEGIIEKMEDPKLVMEQFWLWALRDAPVRNGDHPGGLRFWSKPLTFDWPFIDSYCRQYGLKMPFHYRIARDLNTFIAAKVGDGVNHVGLDHITLAGDAHNALYDAALQLKKLFAAKNGQPEVLVA